MAKRLIERVTNKALARIALDKETGWVRDCIPEGRKWSDTYCADGVIASGNRIIRKGGVIRFGGTVWQDDELIPFVGCMVGAHMGDVYCTDVDIYWGGYPGGERWMTIEPLSE